MLEKVKKSLGITGSYQDDTIQLYIDEVKQYLIDGGVSKVGVITRGVADLWNYGSGGTSFSPYFLQRAIQLSSKDIQDNEEENKNE